MSQYPILRPQKTPTAASLSVCHRRLFYIHIYFFVMCSSLRAALFWYNGVVGPRTPSMFPSVVAVYGFFVLNRAFWGQLHTSYGTVRAARSSIFLAAALCRCIVDSHHAETQYRQAFVSAAFEPILRAAVIQQETLVPFSGHTPFFFSSAGNSSVFAWCTQYGCGGSLLYLYRYHEVSTRSC